MFLIVSPGLHRPERVETAADLAPRIGRSAGWIVERTGVSERRVADEAPERMAASAARRALGSGPPPDLLINASATPRQLIPDTSVFVLRELGLAGIACHSVHATCLSFLVALRTAGALVEVGACRRALVVSSEIGTVARDWAEPESAVLLGDGAAAAVIEPTPEGGRSRLLGYRTATWPSGAAWAELRGTGVRERDGTIAADAGDPRFHMNGPRMFKLAMVHITRVLGGLFADTGLGAADMDLVVPHQPSQPGIESLSRWGFPAERVVNVVAKYGNCIAASLPIALATADAEGRLRRGDKVLLIGTGAGLSVGAAILEW
jgi:3-oxoacyl-[acyl-carrier-protein] synthase-3